MSLLLKVACPSCGNHQDSLIGEEIRCDGCGNDFRALGHGESASRIISVTPDELEHIPYSQRITTVPRNSASSLILSDPTLLDDMMLRDLPMRDNARWAGRVRLIKKLGQGGMGAVYRGFDESLMLDVAVKILPVPPGGREAHFVDRFRQEARISAQINSTNVVRTRDVGENGCVVYLVMDFIDGQTARQLLDRKGLIPVPQASADWFMTPLSACRPLTNAASFTVTSSLKTFSFQTMAACCFQIWDWPNPRAADCPIR